jgi:O-methyltransferase
MIKFFFTPFLCLWMMVSQIGNCSQLDDFARNQVEGILRKHGLGSAVVGSTLQPGFRTLSPELLGGIAKGFYLLNQCLPERLKEGSYLEFGLYRGFSFWFAQQVGNTLAGKDFQYFGFDSFAGLPDHSQDYIGGAWGPGVYAASLEEVTQYLKQYNATFSNLHLIKGWFSQQLFATWEKEFSNPRPSIITIDADVYEACREVLHFFYNYLQPGTIVLFDDFINGYPSPDINNYGERKALKEFLLTHKDFKLAYLFPFGGHGYAFMVTSCRGTSLDQAVQDRVMKLNGNPELPQHRFF